jgi:HlyD family secretion protein
MVQSVVTYDTVIGVDNRDLDLKPGMTANVAIVIARRPDALKIPNAALRFRPPEVLAARTNLTAATSTKPRSGSTRKSAPNPAAIAGSLAKARQTHRTVYIPGSTNLTDSTELIRLEPIQIKTGISDGIFTEVLEGMSEGTTVVLGLNIAKAGSSLLPTKTIFGTKQR